MEITAEPSSNPAETAHLMAIKTAEGAGIPQSWDSALEHLRRAAELGSELAQAEFAALAGDWVLAHEIIAGEKSGAAASGSLGADIDIGAWIGRPLKAFPSQEPRMVLVKNLLEPEICDWLISRARPRLKRATVSGGQKNVVIHENRTGSDCVFGRRDSDIFLAIMRTRIAAVVETLVTTLQHVEVLHYALGQHFKPHYDTRTDPDTAGYGQRLVSVLVALNDDYDGGETGFPVLRKRWKGKKGAALFFWNLDANGVIERRVLHEGMPVTRGEKWIISQFVGMLPPG